jgi:hypothetical protein
MSVFASMVPPLGGVVVGVLGSVATTSIQQNGERARAAENLKEARRTSYRELLGKVLSAHLRAELAFGEWEYMLRLPSPPEARTQARARLVDELAHKAADAHAALADLCGQVRLELPDLAGTVDDLGDSFPFPLGTTQRQLNKEDPDEVNAARRAAREKFEEQARQLLHEDERGQTRKL